MPPTLKPHNLDIASPTMEETFKAFLKAPLFYRSKTEAMDRENTIEILQSYACYHGHKSLSSQDRSLLDGYQQREAVEQRGYHQLFGPGKIPELLPDFFTFMAYEIVPVASQKFVLSTCLTMEELCLWMIRENQINSDEGEEAAYRCAEAARNLPRAMRAVKRLYRDLQNESSEEIRWTSEGEAEKYKIVRLASNFIWLESEGGERCGPLKISDKIKSNLEVGWEIHCSLVKLHSQWKITGLGGIFPYPR